MVLAMLGFAVEDMLIKQMAGALPVGQILATLGLGGVLLFAPLARLRTGPGLFDSLTQPRVMLRNAFEAVGTIGFVTAIALTPISTASAILQAAPLVVTLGAALFLGEQVGWRRWSAIAIGLIGVLLILRPGLDGFDPLSLFAVLGMVALSGRDVVTRTLPPRIHSMKLAVYAFLTLIPTGLILVWVQGGQMVRPDDTDALRLALAVVLGIAAYYCIVLATRVGDLSAVAPFRYSRLVFALVIGVVVFGERPDALTLLGSAIIVASGLYTLWRETRARPASLAEPPLV